MGTVTEWYNFAIICFETGNEDEYDDYEKAFDLFIENAIPTDLFMFINETYSKEIKKGLKDNEDIEPLDKTRLAKYGTDYKPDTKLDDFDAGVMDVLRSVGPNCFSNNNVTIYTPEADKIAFFSKDKEKVFISPETDEYPGDAYEELKASEHPEESSQSENEGGDNPEATGEGADTAADEAEPGNGSGGGVI